VKTRKFFPILIIFIPLNLPAQQATWELVRENFWGKIAIDPANSDIIYVSPGNVEQWGLHKSTDGGQTWTYYGAGYEGIGAEGIVIDPNNPQRLWIYGGAFKGVVRSEDGGMTAVRADTGIIYDHHGYSVTALAYDSKRDILYAGDTAISGGIYRSSDSGRRWEQVQAYGLGLLFNPAFFLVEEDSGWVYSGTSGHGIWLSKDSGETWVPLDPEVLGGQPISFIARVPNSHTLYAASLLGNIYKNYDLGENWTFVSDATTDFDVLTGGLVISLLDTNYIYTGGNAGSFPSGKSGFYLSRDGGITWQLYHVGLPQLDLYYAWSLAQTTNTHAIYLCIRAVVDGVYRLPQALLTSTEEFHSLSPLPNFSLKQNYPNPFNAETRIEFSIAKKAVISLDVFNLTGKHIINLYKGFIEMGNHSVVWDGKDSKGGDVASGIYLLRLQLGENVISRKSVLIR
jgi:hypothetical protein